MLKYIESMTSQALGKSLRMLVQELVPQGAIEQLIEKAHDDAVAEKALGAPEQRKHKMFYKAAGK